MYLAKCRNTAPLSASCEISLPGPYKKFNKSLQKSSQEYCSSNPCTPHIKRPRTVQFKVPCKISDSWAREIVETFQETGSRDKKREIWMIESSVFPLLAGFAFVENAFLLNFLQPSEISLKVQVRWGLIWLRIIKAKYKPVRRLWKEKLRK